MAKKIFRGIIMGILIPLALLGLIYLIFYFSEVTITNQVIASSLLLGLGLNALYIRYLFKNDKDYISRGVMISSFVYFFIWLYSYIL